VVHSLLALGVYVLFALCQAVAVRLGVLPALTSAWWAAGYLGAGLLFYGLIRSGLSQRMGRDPSLTGPQTVFGVVAAVGTYAIAGPLRGGLIAVLMLAVLFGAFKLRPRQARALAVFGFVALGSVMLWQGRGGSALHDPREDLLLLMIAAVTSLAMAVLVERLAQLRARSLRQRAELAEALERIRLLATQDELTGLPNRRAMIDALQAATRRQARLGEPVALVMIDLDHFKAINDGHGHHAGDVVLRGFAERAHVALRAVDLLGRWGGEEFLLLLPDTTLEQAVACVERLREQLRITPFDEVAPGLALNFSAGVTACHGPLDLDAAIERADRAMYLAKGDGRNRTETV
jgi:diguanylate cyclase (GGDEF)-like protein